MREDSGKKVVFVDGSRIPFQRSETGYNDLAPYNLGQMAVKGLLHKTQIKPELVEYLIMGTVVADPAISNVAREIALSSGLSNKVIAYTLAMACISSNRAITNGVDLIRTGQANIVIAGGTDTLSDFPIRYRKKLRKKFIAAKKYRKIWDFFKFVKGLKLKDLLPEIPAIVEFSTGLSMGESCERIAAAFGVTREEQDEYAVRSHKLAAQARDKGFLAKEIYPVAVPPEFKTISQDNTIRDDTSTEKLKSLSPSFDKKYGTITAGNSSSFTDGASAVLLMSEDIAKSLGYKSKTWIREYTYTAHDPLEQLLLGPAFSIPKILDMAGLSLSAISVFEMHEAFAAQIVATMKALNSDDFAREFLGKSGKCGEIPLDRLNTWGGSLSIGHPFGATGARLVTTASDRLVQEKGEFALVASCAAGAMSNAILLENCEK